MQQKTGYDPHRELRRQVRELIEKKYPSVEKFCFEENLHKSTVSRLLAGKRVEFRVSTLMKICAALGKRLSVRIE